MENRAHSIVLDYIKKHLDKSDDIPRFEVYTVWKCKALQNWKFLISSSLLDGMYYELTFNGDRNEWYLDAYKKFENQVIQEPKGADDEEKKVNLSYVEWLEQIAAEYQPDWICDGLVTEDGWCYDRCKSKWDRDCLRRYYNKYVDAADTPQTERSRRRKK